MHRLDPELKLLDSELEMTESEDDSEAIRKQITTREDLLKPVYLQAATEFADLHDKTGRMKAKGVIKSAVPWEESREFFYYRAKRRLSEDFYVAQLRKVDASLTKDSAAEEIKSMYSGNWEDDKSVSAWFESETAALEKKVQNVKAKAVQSQIESLKKELDALEFM
jgi:acetyl-CoA carboxylase/biotin carboxylase 1